MKQEAFLFVAIDNPSYPEAYDIAMELSKVEGNFGFKINLDLILLHGISMLTHFKSLGKPVFADLKMWNGTRTMKESLKSLESCGVDYTNIYALAGEEFLAEMVESTSVKILAMTIMSHYNYQYYQQMFGETIHYKIIERLSEVAFRAKCHGVILPPNLVTDYIRKMPMKKVFPAIRPGWYSDNRHDEAVEPSYAVSRGADMLVCGSPITKAKDKKAALKKILEEMKWEHSD